MLEDGLSLGVVKGIDDLLVEAIHTDVADGPAPVDAGLDHLERLGEDKVAGAKKAEERGIVGPERVVDGEDALGLELAPELGEHAGLVRGEGADATGAAEGGGVGFGDGLERGPGIASTGWRQVLRCASEFGPERAPAQREASRTEG